MLVYIACRFEGSTAWRRCLGIPRHHHTIGLLSLIDKEISRTVVAALLTLVGYSMNETIVVFDDRVESERTLRRESLEG